MAKSKWEPGHFGATWQGQGWTLTWDGSRLVGEGPVLGSVEEPERTTFYIDDSHCVCHMTVPVPVLQEALRALRRRKLELRATTGVLDVASEGLR